MRHLLRACVQATNKMAITLLEPRVLEETLIRGDPVASCLPDAKVTLPLATTLSTMRAAATGGDVDVTSSHKVQLDAARERWKVGGDEVGRNLLLVGLEARVELAAVDFEAVVVHVREKLHELRGVVKAVVGRHMQFHHEHAHAREQGRLPCRQPSKERPFTPLTINLQHVNSVTRSARCRHRQ